MTITMSCDPERFRCKKNLQSFVRRDEEETDGVRWPEVLPSFFNGHLECHRRDAVGLF